MIQLAESSSDRATPSLMRARRMQLYAQHQFIAVMRRDCDVCRAEGLSARTQVLLVAGERQIQAVLYQSDDARMLPGDVALSESAWQALEIKEGDHVQVRHPPLLESLTSVRRRIYGGRLNDSDMSAIVRDVVTGRYSDVHLAAFLTATASPPLDEDETIALTRAMVAVGDRLQWPSATVVDKHCVGGLPGNRTTPIVVAIVAACGLIMPKTSSRAITSPAGTADTMETLTRVDLSLSKLRRVVEQEGGCLAWGGAMHLSPADDIFVRVERELDIDTEGQLIASVLSKKVAAGSSHVLVDIPVGPTAKVRTDDAARHLAARLKHTANAVGLQLTCMMSDGSQPVGRGIGPALEAWDVLAVLRNSADAPRDLRKRAAQVAGQVLEMGGVAAPGEGLLMAFQTLDSGLAWKKFQGICDAQGGLQEPPRAPFTEPLLAPCDGQINGIDNRKLSRLAKLAGAPESKAAGVQIQVQLGDKVVRGQPLLLLHAQTPGVLAYALDYMRATTGIIDIQNIKS